MKKFLILSILLFFVLCLSVLWAKTTNWNEKEPSASALSSKKKTLSRSKLEAATLILHKKSNGSVAPNYHYECVIKVKKDSVDVTICRGYDGEEVYHEGRAISPTEYEQFLNHLAAQNIRTASVKAYTSGGHVSYIKVLKDDEVVFDGSEDYNLTIAKGNLSDAFMEMLSGSMEEAANDPMRLIDPLHNEEE